MESSSKIRLGCAVNGAAVSREIDSGLTLAEFLRGELLLTGTKTGCNQGECGACLVIVNGRAVNSCLFMAAQAEGASIITIEGINKNGPHPLSSAFAEEGAVQCGFCTPGMIVAAYALLSETLSPTRDQIKEALSGNICRCTGYEMIFRAVEKAAAEMRKKCSTPA
ncbi:MAG: (2Fe-2S)-binding protein [Elusimicrobiales bacterium]